MVRIREAEAGDMKQMLDIYNDIILHTTAVYDYQEHNMEMRRKWWEDKKRLGYPVFVAEEEGEVLGYASIGPFRAWAAYKYTVENSVYVKADKRGKGIGRMLMPNLIEAAENLKMHTMIAGIDASNTASIRLHESFGFREVAHFREVGYKFGRWLDLKFLQLLLITPEHPDEIILKP